MERDIGAVYPGGVHFRLVCFFLALFSALIIFGPRADLPAFASGAKVNCDAHSGPCTQTIGDVTVTLEITPRPVKALEDLLFQVSLSGDASATATRIELGMPAMKMGPNSVALEPTGPGKYEGRGVIVKCPSGRRTWYAIVTVPEHGEATFVFDVVY